MYKKNNKRFNIVLTGSSGFIAGNFIKNYSPILNIKNFSFIKDNINSLNLENIDSIVHCAALVHQMKKEPKYEEYYSANVEQTIELAIKAKQSNVKQFIFLSSSKVYGEESDYIFNEKSKTNPIDNYGRSKLEAEKRLLEIEDKNFHVAIVRAPLVYGPGVKANFLQLINLVKKFSLFPLGEINNKRSMVYVENLTHIIHRIIDLNQHGTFLAADDRPISTTELIQKIALAMNKKVVLFHTPLLKEIIRVIRPKYYKRLYMSFQLDNKLTRQTLLIKKNKFSLEESFQKTILSDDK